MLIANMCRPRKWRKRLKAVSLFLLYWQIMSESQNPPTIEKCLLHSSAIPGQDSHVESIFYLVTQNREKYANQVKHCTDAVKAHKLRRAQSNHQSSTSTRCWRPRYRKAYTHFLSETTHTSMVTSQLFSLPSKITGSLRKLMAKFMLH